MRIKFEKNEKTTIENILIMNTGHHIIITALYFMSSSDLVILRKFPNVKMSLTS